MRVVSFELSKKLYDLTNWVDDDYIWIDIRDNEPTSTHGFILGNTTRYQDAFYIGTDWIPAYSVDYLLDQLVEKKTGLTLYHVHSTMNWEAFYSGKFFEYGTDTQHWEYQGGMNPADAVALLAIDLIEKGIIK